MFLDEDEPLRFDKCDSILTLWSAGNHFTFTINSAVSHIVIVFSALQIMSTRCGRHRRRHCTVSTVSRVVVIQMHGTAQHRRADTSDCRAHTHTDQQQLQPRLTSSRSSTQKRTSSASAVSTSFSLPNTALTDERRRRCRHLRGLAPADDDEAAAAAEGSGREERDDSSTSPRRPGCADDVDLLATIERCAGVKPVLLSVSTANMRTLGEFHALVTHFDSL